MGKRIENKDKCLMMDVLYDRARGKLIELNLCPSKRLFGVPRLGRDVKGLGKSISASISPGYTGRNFKENIPVNEKHRPKQ